MWVLWPLACESGKRVDVYVVRDPAGGTPSASSTPTQPTDATDPTDPLDPSAPTTSEPDDAPSAPGISVTPDRPGAAYDDLECAVVTPAVDPEGAQLTYRVEWDRDGAPWIGDTASHALAGDTIGADELEEGQRWTCRVYASDGVNESPAAEAEVEVLPVLILDGDVGAVPWGTWEYAVVSLTGGARLTVSGEVTLVAREVFVDGTSTIDGDGGGELGGLTDLDGAGLGAGHGEDSNAGTGAGHGGGGGAGGSPGSQPGGVVYGASDAVESLRGSGGGGSGVVYVGDDGHGGSGGAAISIEADTLTVDGTITADGAAGQSTSSGAGGGSGGTVLLRGEVVSIHGTVRARGGPGGDGEDSWFGSGGGGGAGGRVKIFWDTSLDGAGAVVRVTGGAGGYGSYGSGSNGAAGTVYDGPLAYP